MAVFGGTGIVAERGCGASRFVIDRMLRALADVTGATKQLDSTVELRRVRARGSRVTRVTGSDVPLSTSGAQRSSWSIVGASSRARAWAATPAPMPLSPRLTAVAVRDCHLIGVERVVFARQPAPLITAVFYQLRVVVRTCGVGNFQNLHGQAVGAFRSSACDRFGEGGRAPHLVVDRVMVRHVRIAADRKQSLAGSDAPTDLRRDLRCNDAMIAASRLR